jgi:hypothetical protein
MGIDIYPSNGASLSADEMPTGIDAVKIGGGVVSNTEFGYLDGVSSAIQAQIDAKAPIASPTFTGTVTQPAVTQTGAQTLSGNFSGSSGNVWIGQDANGPSVNTGAAGVGAIQQWSGGVLNMAMHATYGLVLSIDQTLVGSLYQACRTTLGTIVNAPGALEAALSCNAIRKVRAIGNTATNEAGTVAVACGIKTRAASTSYNLLAVTANTTGQILIIDNSQTAGVITSMRLKQGAVGSISGDTTCYTTSAPSGDQCQMSVSGGYLVATTGDGYTRKMGICATQFGEEY